MSVTIRIPTVLQPSTGGQSEINAQGATVSEALDSLMSQHAETRAKLFDEEGEVRKHVVIMVNDEDVRFLQKLDTPLQPGDKVLLLPSMSGGRQEAQEAEEGVEVVKPTASVLIPSVLQKYLGGRAQIELRAATARQALEQVSAQLRNAPVRLFDEAGRLHRFIVVFVNGELIFSDSGGEMRRTNLLDTPLQEGDEIIIAPAAVGG